MRRVCQFYFQLCCKISVRKCIWEYFLANCKRQMKRPWYSRCASAYVSASGSLDHCCKALWSALSSLPFWKDFVFLFFQWWLFSLGFLPPSLPHSLPHLPPFSYFAFYIHSHITVSFLIKITITTATLMEKVILSDY